MTDHQEITVHTIMQLTRALPGTDAKTAARLLAEAEPEVTGRLESGMPFKIRKLAHRTYRVTMAAEAPALPCPAWCVRDHARDDEGSHSHRVSRDYAQGWVSVTMVDCGTASILSDGNGEIRIHVNRSGRNRTWSIVRPLWQAEQLAEDAETFGRPGLAKLIRELAALVAEAGKEVAA